VFIDFALPDDGKHIMKAKIILLFYNLRDKQRSNDEKKGLRTIAAPFRK
jgi:hypothetical protein